MILTPSPAVASAIETRTSAFGAARAVAFTAVALALTGCAVGPNYKQPAVATPLAYHALPTRHEDAPMSQPQAGDSDLSQWWTHFRDPELENLIGRALRANLDLQTAASRIRQAREQELIAGSKELPSISGTGVGARLHSNSNPLAGLAGGQSGSQGGGAPSGNSGTSLKLYSVGFDATWEADIFGGTRRAVQAAHANTESACGSLETDRSR